VSGRGVDLPNVSIEDPAFGALTATLTQAEAAGHDLERLLQQAADQRALDDARWPARVLTWRIQRLSARPAPSAATSENPEPGRLRQFTTQLKDKLLEAGTTMAATMGVQMAEQALGALVQ
jgi:hypothetical protein